MYMSQVIVTKHNIDTCNNSSSRTAWPWTWRHCAPPTHW